MGSECQWSGGGSVFPSEDGRLLGMEEARACEVWAGQGKAKERNDVKSGQSKEKTLLGMGKSRQGQGK